MARKKEIRCVGILTAGGDCPGLNAAIRGVAKAAMHYGIRVLGIQDGFRGLIDNRYIEIDNRAASGLLTLGGTLIGTSRDKIRKINVGNKILDMTSVAVENIAKMKLDCLFCLGGNGTQKGAMYIHEQSGCNVITLPKTIDNDIAETDISFGFDSALGIATDAIDRLHTTATSHHRIIVCEIMGHKAGWLALGSGIAGGADVILIPEIPYDLEVIANHIEYRRHSNKRFSIIAVAEGAISKEENKESISSKSGGKKKDITFNNIPDVMKTQMIPESKASLIARQLQHLTGIEARVTSLGHVQRGGTPSAYDRLLCTGLGTTGIEALLSGAQNVMIALKGQKCVSVDLHKVAGITKFVPPDHPWIADARLVDTCLGDIATGK